MYLSPKSLQTHLFVIGRPGSGKTWAMEMWALQHALQGKGPGVVDPTRDFFRNFLTRVANASLEDPGLKKRMVIINPRNPHWTVGINPLEVLPGEFPEERAKFLVDTVTTIWRSDSHVVTRMRRIMYKTFLALMRLGLTLAELPKWLTDQDWRKRLLATINDEELHRYWKGEFPQTQYAQTDWAQSTLNRIGDFVDHPDLQLMFGQNRSTINFREIMDEGKILLVNTDKGNLGESNSSLLGAFIVAQFQLAALARASVPQRQRQPYYLYLDEFADYTSKTIAEILRESRKYRLHVILACQDLALLRQVEGLESAVLNNVGNIVCFQIGYEDAVRLAPIMFDADTNAVKERRFKIINFGGVPFPSEEKIYRPLLEVKEELVRRLTRPNPHGGEQTRYYWYRSRNGQPAQRGRTLEAPDPQLNSEAKHALREIWEISGKRYGRPKDVVAEEIEKRQRFMRTKRKAKVEEVEEIEYQWPPKVSN